MPCLVLFLVILVTLLRLSLLPSRHKLGYQWRYEVRNYLYLHGIHLDARELGASGDDLFNSQLSIECKNHREFHLSTWLDQTVNNATPAQLPILAVKRKGKGPADGYAILRVRDFAALLRYAGLADS